MRSILAPLALVMGFAGLPAWPFPVILNVQTVDVVEYRNTGSGRYFLTADPAEMGAVEAGSAGPGWVRTGYSFAAVGANDAASPSSANIDYRCFPDCGVPVSRFYSASSNAHFYTANASEAAGLGGPASEWKFERAEFNVDVPWASSGCLSGGVLIHRLYNNGGAGHASHRYVAYDDELARMLAQGWTDEGVAFCATSARFTGSKSFTANIDLATGILPRATCADESLHTGPCLAVTNLPTPSLAVSGSARLDALTGTTASREYVVPGVADPSLASFVGQGAPRPNATYGIRVSTQGHGPSAWSSLAAFYQFHTLPGASSDERLLPWRGAPADAQLSLFASGFVTSIETAPGSEAYGAGSIEFVDIVSGHRFDFNILAFSTMPLGGPDFLGRDAVSAIPIVSTTYRGGTPFGRSVGSRAQQAGPGKYAVGQVGGAYDFRVSRSEFQQILASARSLDPSLSSTPDDYAVANFRFVNEVYGDGSIGMTLDGLTLSVDLKL